MSVVVADTGVIESVDQFRPVDCTTNPTLVLKAVEAPEYKHLLDQAITAELDSEQEVDKKHLYARVAERLAVNIGCELLKLVPGRVSTEVSAHLSFDTQATIAKARSIVKMYQDKGVQRDRIYIKIASTWQGIEACKQLQLEGIDCNMTLIFSFAQAVACAHAGAALVSPFVGRILDWYRMKEGREYAGEEDPGVLAVHRIFNYYQKFGVKTTVMAASFRNVGEIQQLAGIDKITISPALLAELQGMEGELPRILSPAASREACNDEEVRVLAEDTFEEMHGRDRMAVDKLTEGIAAFSKDQDLLESRIADQLLAQGVA